MTDIKKEEIVNDLISNQSENLREEIIPANNQVSLHPDQETENMEVHHHPDLHHEPKKWKEYFLEFFMIFLAVTLGFLAENLREHIKDKKEVHENIEAILVDLESDVSHFNAVLDINTYSYSLADSLVSSLHNDISNTPQIYFYARSVTANVNYFYANSKTFDLMKSSGVLKLIRPKNLLDSLGLYYVTFQLLTNQDNTVRLKLDAVHKNNNLLFDTYVFSQMKVGFDSINRSHTIVQLPTGNPQLLSTDYKIINEVSLNYYYLAATLKFDCVAAERQKKLAIRLIEIIKKEYSLDNQ